MNKFVVVLLVLFMTFGCATRRVEYVRFDKPVEKTVRILKHEKLPESSLVDPLVIPLKGALIVSALGKPAADGAPRGAHSYQSVDASNNRLNLRVVGEPFTLEACYVIQISRNCFTCDAGEDFQLKGEVPCPNELKQIRGAGEGAQLTSKNSEQRAKE